MGVKEDIGQDIINKLENLNLILEKRANQLERAEKLLRIEEKTSQN